MGVEARQKRHAEVHDTHFAERLFEFLSSASTSLRTACITDKLPYVWNAQLQAPTATAGVSPIERAHQRPGATSLASGV